MFIKIALLVLFFAITIGIGFYCRAKATDVNSFVLGGRNVGPWLTAFAYGTSYFSAVIFIGYAGQFGWKYGISATWIGIGNALIGSLLAWVILGRRTRLLTQHLNSSTMPDFFGKRFDSKLLTTLSSLIIFVFLIPYTASLFNGLSRLFEMAFNIDYTWCVITMAVLTAVYVLVGGYMATAINDFIQGLIMLFGIVAVIVAILKFNGGFNQAIFKLSLIECTDTPDFLGSFTSFFGPNPLELFGVVILTSLGTWGLPQMIGKFYAIDNEESIQKGTIISTIFAFVVAGGCYFMGGFGRLYSADIEYCVSGVPIYDSIIPIMVSYLPDVLIAVVVILVFSASMSTLSSLVLTSGSTLTLDIIIPFSRKKVDEKKKMLIIRVFILFFIVLSSVLAIIQAKFSITFIAQLMGISWGALAGAFLAPFLYSLYWKRVTKASVIASFISGTVIMCANMFCTFTGRVFISNYFRSPINAGMLAMVVGLVLVPLVSIFTAAPSEDKIEEIFSCYNKEITVNTTASMKDD